MRPRARPAFSLLEVALGLAVVTLMAAVATPRVIGAIRQDAAQRAARDMLGILDAAKAFYAAQPPGSQRWPNDLAELKTGGYLPAAFTGATPFATTYSAAPAGSTFTVAAVFPADVAAGALRLLPLAAQAPDPGGVRVTAAVPVPGASSDLSQALLKPGTTIPGNYMTGPLAVADAGGSATAWIDTAGQAYFRGPVGIGTTAPQQTLDVAGNIRTNPSVGWSGVDMYQNGGNRVTVYNQNGAFAVDVPGAAGSNPRLVVSPTGNVGIGTTAPTGQLDVVNDVRADVLYDRYNPGRYVQPRGASLLEDVRAGIYYDLYNTGYYVLPRAISRMHDVRLDNQTTYGWSYFAGICLNGDCRTSWPGGGGGWSGYFQAEACGEGNPRFVMYTISVSNGLITSVSSRGISADNCQ